MDIIDFHTHAFPDAIARKALEVLHSEVFIKAALDGKISSLVESMDKAGIKKSVLCNIATKPSQFEPILDWSRSIRSDRIIPLPSIHPDDPDPAEKIKILAGEGFIGIKMHPYYQDCDLDDPRMGPIYGALCDNDMLVVMHTGYDIAFEFIRKADPPRIYDICKKWPNLKFIASHLGGWMQWEEVEKYLIGKPIYMEISYALNYLPIPQAKKLILMHDPEYILFGTDSPWDDQSEAISRLKHLELPDDLLKKILSLNALKLIT